jgi:hypothetical protein
MCVCVCVRERERERETERRIGIRLSILLKSVTRISDFSLERWRMTACQK